MTFRPLQYILNERDEPVPEHDLIKWGRWLQENRDRLTVASGESAHGELVSTSFLGLDHAFGGGPPLLYETCVFAPEVMQTPFGPLHPAEVVDRYPTRDAALLGHAAVLARANQHPIARRLEYLH